MNEVVVKMIRHSCRWAILALESPIIPYYWPFKVWTISNQIFETNSVGDVLSWWKTRAHQAFQMWCTIALLSISYIGWTSFHINENCNDNNGNAQTLPNSLFPICSIMEKSNWCATKHNTITQVAIDLVDIDNQRSQN